MTQFDHEKPAKGENPLTDGFQKWVLEVLDEWKVPGVSVAVVDDNQIFTQGYGNATVPDTAATAETLWYAASTTKAFTGAVIAELIDSKKYPALEKGWQTTISSVIREDFVLPDEWATNHLTLEDAVCHRSGLPRHDRAFPRYIPDENNEGKMRYATPRDIVRNLRHLPMTAEPRIMFQYCNAMYCVLSHVIETLTGKPLGEVMKDLIWEPLGMSSTYFDLEDAQAAPEHLANGYYWDEDKFEFIKSPFMPVKEISGAGAIMSNVQDYAKWVRCLVHQEKPFSEAVHKDIRTPRFLGGVPNFGKDVGLYGIGWDRTSYKGHTMYGHGGGMHAYGCQVYWFPDAKFGVVAFANTCMTSNAVCDVLLYKLIHERLGITKENQSDQNAGWHDAMNKAIENNEKHLDYFYPNRPETAVPSPTSIKDLTGTYSDSGYRAITLRVEPDPEQEGKELLVGERDLTTWQYQWRLNHVSGTWWIMELVSADNPTKLLRSWHKVGFHFGPDGKPTGFTVKWWEAWSDTPEGDILLKRED